MSKNVLITGAGKGLGFALTRKYLALGCKTFACLYAEPSEENLRLQKNYGQNLKFLYMDVSDDRSVQQARDEFAAISDSIDILINNAGVHFDASYRALEDFDFDVALNTLNINSLGPLRVVKAFLKYIEKGDMKVIANISSEAGSICGNFREKEYDYCMSKSALNMQSVILQKYLKPKGIKILAIHPGWMKTDMGGPGADIDADISAEGIAQLIDKYKGDVEGPIYMDYQGVLLDW